MFGRRREPDKRHRLFAATGKRFAYTLLELMIVLAILVSVMAVAWPRITRRLQLVGPREAALQLKADLDEAREQSVLSGEPWAVRIERGQANYEVGPVSVFRDRQSQATTFDSASSFESPLGMNALGEPVPEASFVEPTTGDPRPTPGEIWKKQLPIGMVFDDGMAHQTQDANQVRDQGIAAIPNPPQLNHQLNNGTPINADPILNPNQPQVMPMPNPITEQNQVGMTVAPAAVDQWKLVVIYQPDGRATESEIRLREEVTENKIRLRIRGFTGGVTIDGLERKPPADQLQPDGLPDMKERSPQQPMQQSPGMNVMPDVQVNFRGK